MTPVSHASYTTPAAAEQVGDTAEPPIVTMSNDVLIHYLFPYLEPSNLHHVGQACHWFRDASRRVWQLRAQEICRTCAELLPSFGITPPVAEPTPEEASALLNRTVQRVKQIQKSLPAGLQPQFSANDLVCKVGSGHMQEFLQKAYDYSLRTVFGRLAHVPACASLEESVRQIREWLQTAEAGQIQWLNPAKRGLCCLPGEIGQLTALQTLCLTYNQLTSLPPEIGQLTALQSLYLDHNLLTSLPSEIGRLTALQSLYMGHNQLTSPPPEIGRLAALQGLFLDGNHLTSLPREIGQLTALTKLNVGNNLLTSLPKEIGRMTALESLTLSDNHLTTIPLEIGRLTALRWLGLERNRLAFLPPIEQLRNLLVLALDGNPLQWRPAGLSQYPWYCTV